MKTILTSVFALTLVAAAAAPAAAECNCLSVAADVSAAVQAEVARADNLYARGDYDAALAGYARAYARSNDAALLYAQAMTAWQLGAAADARAHFEAYLAAGGDLAYRARAEAAVAAIAGGATRAVDGLAGAAVGAGGRLRGGLEDGVGAGAGVVGGAGAGVAGQVDAATRKPKKVAKGAAIVLGVVAVAAVGAVAVQGISAGLKDDVDFDKKFGLGVGLSGAVMGGTAIYLWGLTATAGAAGGVRCADAGTVIAPVAYPSGAGVAAAFRF